MAKYCKAHGALPQTPLKWFTASPTDLMPFADFSHPKSKIFDGPDKVKAVKNT